VEPLIEMMGLRDSDSLDTPQVGKGRETRANFNSPWATRLTGIVLGSDCCSHNSNEGENGGELHDDGSLSEDM
jgi:hypothetical protein